MKIINAGMWELNHFTHRDQRRWKKAVKSLKVKKYETQVE